MPSHGPNFSPFPFERLPRLSHDHAAIQSAIARQLAARSAGSRLAKLMGGPVRIVRIGEAFDFDSNAAIAELRANGLSIAVAAASAGVRAIAQKLLGGPDEASAPRPPTVAEDAAWALVLATAIADAGVTAEVWPLSDAARIRHARELEAAVRRAREAAEARALIGRGGLITDEQIVIASQRSRDRVEPAGDPTTAGSRRSREPINPGDPATVAGSRRSRDQIDGSRRSDDSIVHASTVHAAKRDGAELAAARPPGRDAHTTGEPRPAFQRDGVVGVELAIDLAGIPLTVVAWCPGEILFRVPPPRPRPPWAFELPIVVARCALSREAIGCLAVRDVVVVERELRLIIGDGAIGLVATPGAVEATVATGYVPADMGLPDDAHLELTVRLGTTRLSLRRIGELAVGEIIALGRPLAGPYEIHAGGRLIGAGELVDVDGEIGVRIVSLTQE